MSLNQTVSAERIHIGFFGMRNAGKSSLVNAVTGQDVSVVSDVKGTTTDTVKKSMELLPLGPVVIIDTAGLDDEGKLGELRVKKAKRALDFTDIAVIVIDAGIGISDADTELMTELNRRKIPFITVLNKADTLSQREILPQNQIYASAKNGEGIDEIKNALGAFAKNIKSQRPLISDLIHEKDTVILVTPIDESAPKGRIILPQQMLIRDILDSKAVSIVCQPSELSQVLASLKEVPRLVVTDSQVFAQVSKIVPDNISLTSFSIIMARYKGDLKQLCQGFEAISNLSSGDKVLICEGCTHHRQCNDIGTVKIPNWVREYTKSEITFEFTSGNEFPSDLSEYKLIIHCGGCMLNEAEMQSRLIKAEEAGIPIVNYGVAIAGMKGILERSLAPFQIKIN